MILLNMKINYLRNLNASLMVLDQIEELQEWEQNMIFYNEMEGIIFPEQSCENGIHRLWYNITGKQSLDIILETMELDYDLLCKIFSGIYIMSGKLEELLLPVGYLILLPECIFLDHQTEQISFCYYPQKENDFYRDFLSLAEFLLTKLNHKDEKAVKFAYEVYERALKDGFCMAEMQTLICFSYASENLPDEEADSWTQGDVAEEGAEQEVEKLLPEYKDESKYSVFGIIKGFIENMISQRKYKVGNQKKKEEPFVFEPEEEEKSQSHPTVLLKEISNNPIGMLQYEGYNSCKDLKVEKFPFIIGSDPAADGCIPSETVSRRHARITKKEDIYFIEDLNSSNGTFIGGELLNCRVKMSLQKNEIVIFADEKFRFI